MLKKKAETSAEAIFEAVSSQSATESGRGIINSRKAAGNAKVRIHSRPRTKNPPAYKKQRNEKVTRPRESFLERPPEKNPRARIAAAPSVKKGIAQDAEVVVFFGRSLPLRSSKYPEIRGIRRMCECKVVPAE